MGFYKKVTNRQFTVYLRLRSDIEAARQNGRQWKRLGGHFADRYTEYRFFHQFRQQWKNSPYEAASDALQSQHTPEDTLLMQYNLYLHMKVVTPRWVKGTTV